MPVIFSFFGLRFMFFSNDHEPVHIHVVKGKGNSDESAVFQVYPEVELRGNHGLKPSELKMAEALIEENKETIIENWNIFFKKLK
jgi:hypothetical protein